MVDPPIPIDVNGQPVEWVFRLDPPLFPRGYPGDGPLEETCALLLSVASKGNEDERYFVTCLGVSGRLMAGEMYFTLEGAKSFPYQEFDPEGGEWTRLEH